MATGLNMPTRIPDALIEEAADNYRKMCGPNDVLIHKMKPVTFEYYLSLHIASVEIAHALAAHDARMML